MTQVERRPLWLEQSEPGNMTQSRWRDEEDCVDLGNHSKDSIGSHCRAFSKRIDWGVGGERESRGGKPVGPVVVAQAEISYHQQGASQHLFVSSGFRVLE